MFLLNRRQYINPYDRGDNKDGEVTVASQSNTSATAR